MTCPRPSSRCHSAYPAMFLWGGLHRSNPVQRLALQHGDVLVWSGASRMHYHGVNPLKDGHHDLLGSERWNLTFRLARGKYTGGTPCQRWSREKREGVENLQKER